MQSARRFLDYVVNAESLYDRHGADDISCLGWLPHDADEQAAQRLLGTVGPDVEDRVALWVCAECGDVLCGALTARIAREGDEIVWRDFARRGVAPGPPPASTCACGSRGSPRANQARPAGRKRAV